MWKILWSIIAITAIIVGSIVSHSTLEVVAASIVGVLFVLGVAFKKPVANLFGVLLCLMLGLMSYQAGYYMNAIINTFILAPLQVLAYLNWSNGTSLKPQHQLLIRWVVKNRWPTYVVLMVPTMLVACLTGSNLWLHDAVSASLVIVATLLLMCNVRQQWEFWIPYNAIEVFMWFIAASLDPEMLAIMLMRVVFFVNSLIGFYEWRKDGSPRTLLQNEAR